MEEDSIVIEREFNAPVEKVWSAWTDPELIKKWWGPRGFTAPSIKNDLRVGGKYIYAMHGPEGTEWDKDMYSAGEYKEIIPNQKLVVTDYFSNADGNKISPAESEVESSVFPDEQTVTILFKELGENKTKLSIVYPKPETDAQLQAMLKSGMKEGWSESLDKLAESLE